MSNNIINTLKSKYDFEETMNIMQECRGLYDKLTHEPCNLLVKSLRGEAENFALVNYILSTFEFTFDYDVRNHTPKFMFFGHNGNPINGHELLEQMFEFYDKKIEVVLRNYEYLQNIQFYINKVDDFEITDVDFYGFNIGDYLENNYEGSHIAKECFFELIKTGCYQ